MTITVGHDTAKTRKQLTVGSQSVSYYSIAAAQEAGLGDFSKLPAALKVVLENLLRFEDNGFSVSIDDIKAFSQWAINGGKNPREIAYRPARVLMQDFTGVVKSVYVRKTVRSTKEEQTPHVKLCVIYTFPSLPDDELAEEASSGVKS